MNFLQVQSRHLLNCSFIAVCQGGWICIDILYCCRLGHCGVVPIVPVSDSLLSSAIWALCLCAEAVQSALSSSSQEIAAYLPVYSVCPRKKVSSGSLWHHLYNLVFLKFSFYLLVQLQRLLFFPTYMYMFHFIAKNL